MNHLREATSPYLQQHRDNPVDWYPWGEEAFERGRNLDRPMLVSIGYSACHWCHVMAHESFEDDEIASLVNDRFVAIKVDREERPDVDAIYMEAVQALSGHGGWPLNVFTTPQGQPFFGGTYFPPQEHGQLPSFRAVLIAVSDAWVEMRDELDEQARELTTVVAQRIDPPRHSSSQNVDASALLERAMARFEAMYDPQNGGIGDAPKFPQAPMLELVLRGHLRGQPRALEMVETTLSAMASGGIYDQIGGGFCRYSVDRSWTVPHFEKMLYDQAALARLYLHAWQITGDERWRQIVDETLAYVLRDLADPHGGFSSSEDADSEGEEGKFYAFSEEEFYEVLGPERWTEAARWFGVTAAGNFEHRTNVLHRAVRGDLLRPESIERARAALFAHRSQRVRPGKDDKILTEWNAMIGTVFCEAADATGNSTYRDAAMRIGEFLTVALRRADGRWLRSWRDGRAEHLAVASDYAWLVEFFTRLATTTGMGSWLDEATNTAANLRQLFATDDGALFTTGSDAPSLVVRPREIYDGVTPAAGSIAANAFVRLGALTGDDDLVAGGARLIESAGEALSGSPIAFSYLVNAALSLDPPPIEVVIAGDRPDLVSATKQRYMENAVIAWGERRDNALWLDRPDGHAYVCHYGECLAPVDSVEALHRSIDYVLDRDHP